MSFLDPPALSVPLGDARYPTKLEVRKRLRPSYLGDQAPTIPLYPPPAVDAVVVGTAGSTVRSYRITALNGSGESLPCAIANFGGCPDTLSTSNYMALSWAAVPGAESYNVYRSNLLIVNTVLTSYNDQGAVAGTTQPPKTRRAVANNAPTVTGPSGAANSQITGSVLVSPATPSAFTYLGTVPGYGAGALSSAYVTSPPGAATNSGTQPGDGNPWAVEFDYDGSAFEVAVVGSVSGQVFRVSVGGEYVQSTGFSQWPIDNQTYYSLVDFGSRAIRRVRIDFKPSMNFAGILRQPTATVIASPRSPLRMIVFGDSFTQPTYSDNFPGIASFRFNDTGHVGYPFQLGTLLGVKDTWASGLGGTGYLNAGVRKTFRQRIGDITSWSPDAVLVVGGFNDQGQSPAAMTTETLAFWRALRTALPRTLLMGAVNNNKGPTGSNWANLQSQVVTPVRNAIADVGGTYLDLLALWSGTGNLGAPVGDGTCDVLVGPDQTHPSVAGHRTIARWLAMLIDQTGSLA